MTDNSVEFGKFQPTQDTRLGRMLTAGRVTATMRSLRTGQHITLTLQSKTKGEKWQSCPFAEASHVFIKRGHGEYGSDTIGTYYPKSGKLFWKSRDEAWRYAALHTLLAAKTGEQMTVAYTIQEASICGKCGKELTDPVSIERGIGPTCLGALTGSVHYRQLDENLVEQAREVTQRPSSVPGNRPVTTERTANAVVQHGGTLPETDKRGRPVPRSFEALAAAVKR